MQAVKDIYQVICYYRRSETNSFSLLFFFFCEIKTLINFQVRASWASPFVSVLKMCFQTSLIHSSQRGRGHTSRAILGNLAWPETWRWRVDGGRTLLLFTAHLAPLHPDTHTIYEDNRRARCALLEHSLMDGCETRGRQATKTMNEVRVSYSFHYCKLKCLLGNRKKNTNIYQADR